MLRNFKLPKHYRI